MRAASVPKMATSASVSKRASLATVDGGYRRASHCTSDGRNVGVLAASRWKLGKCDKRWYVHSKGLKTSTSMAPPDAVTATSHTRIVSALHAREILTESSPELSVCKMWRSKRSARLSNVIRLALSIAERVVKSPVRMSACESVSASPQTGEKAKRATLFFWRNRAPDG